MSGVKNRTINSSTGLLINKSFKKEKMNEEMFQGEKYARVQK